MPKFPQRGRRTLGVLKTGACAQLRSSVLGGGWVVSVALRDYLPAAPFSGQRKEKLTSKRTTGEEPKRVETNSRNRSDIVEKNKHREIKREAH